MQLHYPRFPFAMNKDTRRMAISKSQARYFFKTLCHRVWDKFLMILFCFDPSTDSLEIQVLML